MKRNKLGQFIKGVSQNVLSDHPNWKGGRRKRNKYIYVRVFNHPFADIMGYIAEHRHKIEIKIGRYLTRDEVVHHKNRDTLDNRESNLELMTKSTHVTYHNIERGKKMVYENNY